MKKILSALVSIIMLIGAMGITPAMASITEKDYTFIDTCYSPELGVYIAVAKNFVNSDNQPAMIYASSDGEKWTMAKKFSSSKHYIFPENRQLVTWWEAQHMFVAVMLNRLYSSKDGYTWEQVPESVFNRSNDVITSNGKQLVICAKASVMVYEDFDNPPVVYGVDKSPNNNTYGKAVGASPEEPYTYAVTDQYKAWLFDSTKPIDPEETRSDASGQLTSNIAKNPFDMAWSDSLNGWVTINGTSALRVLDNDNQTVRYQTLAAMKLSDGTDNAEEFTALGVNEDNIVLGTKAGRLLIAPNDSASMTTSAQWTIAESGKDSEINEELRSVSAVNDGMFLVVSKTGIYMLMKDDDGVWRYYDVFNDTIELDNNRIEIPVSGNVETTVEAVHYNYKGNVSDDGIVSLELISELPDGVTSENISDTKARVSVDSTVSGGHEIKYRAVTASGTTKELVVTIVDEDHIGMDVSDNMVIPISADETEKYEYAVSVIGTDGKPMEREVVTEIAVPLGGVTFDSDTGIFTVDITTQPGELVIKAYSAANPKNVMEKHISVARSKPVRAELTEAPDSLYIPNDVTATHKYIAKLYDQIDRELTAERVKWSVEAKDIESMDGITMDEDKGVLSLAKTAKKGIVTVTAVAENNEAAIVSQDVILNYTDLRVAQEDRASFRIDVSEPVTEKLSLVTSGPLGSTVSWYSADESVIKTDGTVIRPSREDKKVTITGTWKYKTGVVSKTFELMVPKAENLCVNGDLENGTTEGWSPKSGTELSVTDEDGKSVLKSSGSGVYQTVAFTNDSSYGFKACVKAASGSKIRLLSEKGGTLAEITADGSWQEIKASYDYRRQRNSFDDKISLEYNGELLIDKLEIYEITLELNEASAAVNKAMYSKSGNDISTARKILENFYDLPVKDELIAKLDSIKPSSSGSSGSGGGGGGSASSSKGGTAPSMAAINTISSITTPVKQEDNTADELDTYLLRFKDMKNHWAREDVEYMAELGVVSGDDNEKFRPDDKVSRAEFAKMIVLTMELGETAYENSFFDVTSDDWYSGYVQTVRSNNYMNGYDGLFIPKSAITREELAKVIVSAYNSKAGAALEKGKTLYFNDLEDISYWAYDYIVEATDMGFINGITDELFAPKQPATRAQAATMLKRVYDKLHPAGN